MQMNVNKKLLQQELVQETGNVVLLKDLTNIAYATKRGKMILLMRNVMVGSSVTGP